MNDIEQLKHKHVGELAAAIAITTAVVTALLLIFHH